MAKTFTCSPYGFLHFFVEWFNENIADTDVPILQESEAYCVWFAYVLGNAKCLVSTTRPDHRYYELTYDSEKSQVYVDNYVKLMNKEENVLRMVMQND